MGAIYSHETTKWLRLGSVYKLSGNRRRPWIARKTIGWDEEKKQLYQTIGYFETRKLALEALAEHNKKPFGPKDNITLKELYKEWSESKYPTVTEKTSASYITAWGHLEKLGNMKFK